MDEAVLALAEAQVRDLVGGHLLETYAAGLGGGFVQAEVLHGLLVLSGAHLGRAVFIRFHLRLCGQK